ncbi:signal transduction histidine kinase [Streptomyces aurantiacus]|uniref:sensor histidine kinase n=1 Tax=Streptomyces aurantiacus TaxID=47760 RepID=UPI0027940379|nr:sensor histidine kinase [Streptomyces aurantiacus]MDQ0775551.1 signal transduction histidine kinase [Streptomyces aurantiacus]
MLVHLRRHAQQYPRLVEMVLLLLVWAATSNQYRRTDADPMWWPGFVIAGVVCACLPARRRHPGPVVGLTTLGTVLVGSQGCMVGPLLLLPVIVALYELTLRSAQRVVLTYCLCVALVLLPTALRWDPVGDPWVDQVVSLAFWILLPVLYGSAVRSRRAYLNAVQARAEQAERILEEEARHRVYEERIRIARELHDVVAHHMALANAQAGTAAHLYRTRPEQAHAILTELTVTTTEALRELQATVGLLRHSDTAQESLEPAPGLDRLDDLVAAFAAAGLHITVDTDGPRQPLSAGTDLTAFRIVQEALTNVAKHAAVSTAHIQLVYARDRLAITVSDEGNPLPRPRARGGGFGLVGMRERAQSAGGHLRAGRRPEGGFAVTAELPIHA